MPIALALALALGIILLLALLAYTARKTARTQSQERNFRRLEAILEARTYDGDVMSPDEANNLHAQRWD